MWRWRHGGQHENNRGNSGIKRKKYQYQNNGCLALTRIYRCGGAAHRKTRSARGNRAYLARSGARYARRNAPRCAAASTA